LLIELISPAISYLIPPQRHEPLSIHPPFFVGAAFLTA
jgi:hypothetical protein